MKTDSFFYRFFSKFLGAFFVLIGEDEQTARRYKFTSIEVKEQAFRIDGVVLPATPEDPLYFFEAQFKKEADFYLRFFGEAAVYLRQNQPKNPWRAVVLFPSKEFDPGVHPHYQEFFDGGRMRRVYLTELPEAAFQKFPLNLLKIIIDSKQKVLSTAEQIIRQLPDQVSDEKEQKIIIELLTNLLLSKLPQLSREEIQKMFEPLLSDVKKSRFYQEVAEEIEQELTPKIAQERSREIAKALLRKKMTFEFISEVTGLSQAELRTLKKGLAARKN
jgi:predicted transposase/invertase (TIGR01784 family)